MPLTKQKRNWILFAACALLLAATVVLFLLRPIRAPLSQREVATQVLAQYLAKTAAPKSVLVIGNPYTQNGASSAAYSFEKASEAGLEKGFGPTVPIKVAFPKFKPEALRDPTSVYVPPNCTTPLVFLLTDDAFEESLRAHADCDVVVSLIGVPANPGTMLAATKSFAFLLPDFKFLGDPATVRHLFKSKRILAAVIAKPGSPPVEKVASADLKREFEARFILVTSETIDQHLPLLLK